MTLQALIKVAKYCFYIKWAAMYPWSLKPVDTDNSKKKKKKKCKPVSCCPHLFFNVRRRGGPALWDGNLMHINTRLHLWGSEGKTLRPSYRGWKGYTWIKSEAASVHVRAHGQTHARAHAYTHRIPHTKGLEAITVWATMWDVSGPTPMEAVNPLRNVLGEVRLHTGKKKQTKQKT